jgi:hypothetical protein
MVPRWESILSLAKDAAFVRQGFGGLALFEGQPYGSSFLAVIAQLAAVPHRVERLFRKGVAKAGFMVRLMVEGVITELAVDSLIPLNMHD